MILKVGGDDDFSAVPTFSKVEWRKSILEKKITTTLMEDFLCTRYSPREASR